ncbi:MAG: metallophosphoesterase [Candidatus Izemoplasmatales bacterium]
MRIMIFSDNHGDNENIARIIKKHQPLDRIVSLGDSEMREEELSQMGIIGVKGNFPFEPKFPYDLNFIFEGWNFFFTHGHKYHVKMGTSRILQKAYYEKIDIVCFGHTHQTFLEEISDIVLLNPGSLSYVRSRENPTYALIDLTVNKLEVKIINIYGNIIKSLEKTR